MANEYEPQIELTTRATAGLRVTLKGKRIGVWVGPTIYVFKLPDQSEPANALLYSFKAEFVGQTNSFDALSRWDEEINKEP